MSPLPLSPKHVLGIARTVRDEAAAVRPVVVAGKGSAALALRLAAGAAPGAVVTDDEPVGAGVYVRLVEGNAAMGDVAALRAAARARTPIVVVRTAPGSESIPYVLPHDVVETGGADLALPQVAQAIARAGGDRLVPAAAHAPALREPLAAAIVRRAALQNGLVGALARAGTASFPAMATRQVQLLYRLATVNGRDAGKDQAVELAAVVGLGLGLRAAARRAALPAPLVGFATGYLGTRLIGAAAARRFAARASDG